MVQQGYGPILCGRFEVKNTRVVEKVGEKEIPLGEKETPLCEKRHVGENINFVQVVYMYFFLAKKYIVCCNWNRPLI